jgi:hypothetical protein
MRQVTSQMSLFIHHIHTEDNLSNKQRPRSIIHRLACLHLQVTVVGRRVYFVYVSWPSYSWQKEKLVQDLRAIANDLDTASLYDHLITLLHVTQDAVQLACRASKYIYSRTSVRRSVGVGYGACSFCQNDYVVMRACRLQYSAESKQKEMHGILSVSKSLRMKLHVSFPSKYSIEKDTTSVCLDRSTN